MKFIYCTKADVSKDLESAGLKKLGETFVNGKKIDIFLNNKETYLNKYQKGWIFLANQLLFTLIEE
jgi:hypothetical protein